MIIHGRCGDDASTRERPARMVVEGGHARLLTADGEALSAVAALNSLEVSSRIGDTPRSVRFPDGQRFTTDDNDAVDLAFGVARPTSWLAHRLESRWQLVLIALVVTAGCVFSVVKWGIPAAANHVAHQLPPSVPLASERTALNIIDGRLLRPSRLDAAEHARLQALFRPMLDAQASELPLRVIFRDASHSIGANAIALPGGTVVFTDQLVRLARHDEELLAILAHEIGHVVHRHSLRSTVQASTLALAAMLVLGDVSSVASGAASIPVLLTELGYSRNFEREADAFAVEALHRLGIAPTRLADILQRLAPEDHAGYLTTHPPTPERIRAIHAAAERAR